MERRLFILLLAAMALFFGLLPTQVCTQEKPAIFPAMSGWKMAETVQTFSPETLYDYINGASDLYLTYDFQELQVGEYTREDKASVIVEIYRHKTPTQAFGIYSQERMANADFLDIGAQGYYEDKNLNFLNGPNYVKISSAKTGADDREILIQFAKKISASLGSHKTLPVLLASFPDEGKVKNTEKFIGKNFLGYSYFHSAFTVDYNLSGQKFQLFLMLGESTDDCRNRLQKYFQQVKRPPEQIVEKRYEISDPYHGSVEIFCVGKYIGGTLNLPPSPLRGKYLSAMEARLPK
jgi:hypothetical protein